jgi:hypothetical protein
MAAIAVEACSASGLDAQRQGRGCRSRIEKRAGVCSGCMQRLEQLGGSAVPPPRDYPMRIVRMLCLTGWGSTPCPVDGPIVGRLGSRQGRGVDVGPSAALRIGVLLVAVISAANSPRTRWSSNAIDDGWPYQPDAPTTNIGHGRPSYPLDADTTWASGTYLQRSQGNRARVPGRLGRAGRRANGFCPLLHTVASGPDTPAGRAHSPGPRPLGGRFRLPRAATAMISAHRDGDADGRWWSSVDGHPQRAGGRS